MLNAQEQMQFVIRFAGMDLDRLRPGDWLNLQDDFLRYLSGQQGKGSPGLGPVYFSTFEHLPSEPLTEEAIRQLQGEVKAILHNVIELRELTPAPAVDDMKAFTAEGMPGSRTVKVHQTPLQIRCRLSPLDSIGLKGRTHLGVNGPAQDVFLLSIFLLFAYERTGRIGRCPTCHVLFLPVKKQVYCSKRCQMRVYMQQYRSTEEGKAKESDRSHTRYANKRKRQLSEKVHVVRRPRKGRKTP